MTAIKYLEGGIWKTLTMPSAVHIGTSAPDPAVKQLWVDTDEPDSVTREVYGHWGSIADNASPAFFDFGSHRNALSTVAQTYMTELDANKIKILVAGVYEIHCGLLTYITPAAAIRQDAVIVKNQTTVGNAAGVVLEGSIGISTATYVYVKHALFWKGPLAVNDTICAEVRTGGRSYPDAAPGVYNNLFITYKAEGV